MQEGGEGMNSTLRQKEIVRGRILQYLDLIYPQPATLPLLQGELDILGFPVPMDDLNFHIAYLAEKGLLSIDTPRGPASRKVTLVKITARGIDFYEGRLPTDEGIYLEPRE